MTKPSPRTITWLLVSRIAALIVVFTLLLSFVVAAFTHTMLDAKVVISFLSIAFALLFGPATAYGIQIIRKRTGDSNGSSSD